MTGTITWSGPLDDTSAITAQGTFPQLRIALGAESFEAQHPAAFRLENGFVRIDDVVLVSGPSRLSVRGVYPVDATGLWT